MTKVAFFHLEVGDIVRHASGETYIVTANYGDRVTAVRSVDMTQPGEWQLVAKSRHETPGPNEG